MLPLIYHIWYTLFLWFEYLIPSSDTLICRRRYLKHRREIGQWHSSISKKKLWWRASNAKEIRKRKNRIRAIKSENWKLEMNERPTYKERNERNSIIMTTDLRLSPVFQFCKNYSNGLHSFVMIYPIIEIWNGNICGQNKNQIWNPSLKASSPALRARTVQQVMKQTLSPDFILYDFVQDFNAEVTGFNPVLGVYICNSYLCIWGRGMCPNVF